MESQKIKPIIYEKTKNGYIVGIDIKDEKNLTEIGKLIYKGDASRLNYYCDDRIHFISKEKLK